ncbi:unnamed protein product, partial [Discosporangium mesarthrocarpum]
MWDAVCSPPVSVAPPGSPLWSRSSPLGGSTPGQEENSLGGLPHIHTFGSPKGRLTSPSTPSGAAESGREGEGRGGADVDSDGGGLVELFGGASAGFTSSCSGGSRHVTRVVG